MSDNELLLAISNLMDKKLEPIQRGLKATQQEMRDGLRRIDLILENEIRPGIKLLAENYVPSAKRFEKASTEEEALRSDVDLLKKVVAEHSEKLQKIS